MISPRQRDGILAAKRHRELESARELDHVTPLTTRLFTRDQASAVREALDAYGEFVRLTYRTNTGVDELKTVRYIQSGFPTHVPYNYQPDRTTLPVIFRALVRAYQTKPRSALGLMAYGIYQSWHKRALTPPGEIGNDRREDKRRRYTAV